MGIAYSSLSAMECEAYVLSRKLQEFDDATNLCSGCHAIATLVSQRGWESRLLHASEDLATNREACLYERIETVKRRCTMARHVSYGIS